MTKDLKDKKLAFMRPVHLSEALAALVGPKLCLEQRLQVWDYIKNIICRTLKTSG